MPIAVYFILSGLIVDLHTGNSLPGSRVVISELNIGRYADAQGRFAFQGIKPGQYTLVITMLGYDTLRKKITIIDKDVYEEFQLTSNEKVTEAVVIQAIRADEKLPITQYTLGSKRIEELYFGHDVPILLAQTPGMNTYSENGTGIGYTYFRLRGIDMTRINITINGMPVNDPEDQAVFFTNFTDLLNSTKSIQIQRGVGTSTNGTSSFGGSINIATLDLRKEPGAEISTGYGSFNSRRAAVEFHTGYLGNKFSFYGRLSSISTDGYRERSNMSCQSFFLSGGWLGEKTVVKFNLFSGRVISRFSYLAVDSATLANNRRFNPINSPEDGDNFPQTFYQLQLVHQFNKKLNIFLGGYYVFVDGNYYQTVPSAAYGIFNTDYALYNLPYPIINNDTIFQIPRLVQRFSLLHNWWGAMANLNYTNNKMQINVGLHANTFRREHRQRVASAEIMPAGYGPNHLVYDNAGYKREFSAFLKYVYEIIPDLSLFTDIQFRTADFRYVGKDQPILRDTFNIKPISWTFLNPKVGVRYQIRKQLSSYLSWGKTTREPTRLDMFSGADRATYTIDLSLVKPETVSNFEMGVNYKSRKSMLNVNVYRMDFRDEIAATGELNPQGWPIRRNAGTSFRSGIELEWQQQILINKLYFLGNATLSRNRIKEFRQFYDVYDEANNFIRKDLVVYRNVNPFLTPTVTFNTALNWQPSRWLGSEISARYISSAFLDNTNDQLMTTGDYWVLDLRLTLKLASLFASSNNTEKEYNLSFQFNNITSTKFTPSGYTYSYYTEFSDGTKKLNRNAYYYPSALFNYFITFSCKL